MQIGAKASKHFVPAVPSVISQGFQNVEKEYDIVFVGQWSGQHTKRNSYLHALALHAGQKNKAYKLGYFLAHSDGSEMPPEVSELNRGARWGSEMYSALASGKIVINAEIDLASGEAGNMRLFETAGVGSFMLSEYHQKHRQLLHTRRRD